MNSNSNKQFEICITRCEPSVAGRGKAGSGRIVISLKSLSLPSHHESFMQRRRKCLYTNPRDYRVTHQTFLSLSLSLDTHSCPPKSELSDSFVNISLLTVVLYPTCFSCRSKSHQGRGLHLHDRSWSGSNKIIITK